jgi:hypothetical protein
VATLAFAGPPKFTALEQHEWQAVHAQENMDVPVPFEGMKSVVQLINLFSKLHIFLLKTQPFVII